MATRKEILAAIKTDIEDHVDPANGYNYQPFEVIHGIVSFDDFAQKPSVGYFMVSDEKNTDYAGREDAARIMTIYVYMYADTSLGNLDPIYDFCADIEKFFYSTDWTYTDQTLLGDINIIVGGVSNDKAMGDLIIQVHYQQQF